MTQLEKYEEELYRQDIILFDKSLPENTTGMCIKFDDTLNLKSIICYDGSKLNHKQQDIFGIIMHEEAHLNHPETLYSLDDPIDKIKAKERKVNRIICRKHVPQQVLFEMIYKKRMELFEIAEELCIPESIIQDAYNYYSNLESWIKKKNLIEFD